MAHSTFNEVSGKRPIRDRIESNISIVPITGCWMWLGSLDHSGYGKLSVRMRGMATPYPMPVHRASYEVFVGKIPSGLSIDHLCRNRWCVNPSHLEPVTPKENSRRGVIATATKCRRGHEFTPENTMRQGRNGMWRLCKTCLRMTRAAWRASR